MWSNAELEVVLLKFRSCVKVEVVVLGSLPLSVCRSVCLCLSVFLSVSPSPLCAPPPPPQPTLSWENVECALHQSETLFLHVSCWTLLYTNHCLGRSCKGTCKGTCTTFLSMSPLARFFRCAACSTVVSTTQGRMVCRSNPSALPPSHCWKRGGGGGGGGGAVRS